MIMQALLEGLEKAVNEEEVETVIIYIAMVANPHPQLITKLENLITSDVHSGDPLLLVYGAIVSRASPELQQRMTISTSRDKQHFSNPPHTLPWKHSLTSNHKLSH